VADEVDRARLREESLDEIGALGAFVRQDLDRDPASDGRIDTFVYASHPTRADQVNDAVRADHGPEQWIAGRRHQRCAILSAEPALLEGEAALGAHVHERSRYHCVPRRSVRARGPSRACDSKLRAAGRRALDSSRLETLSRFGTQALSGPPDSASGRPDRLSGQPDGARREDGDFPRWVAWLVPCNFAPPC